MLKENECVFVEAGEIIVELFVVVCEKAWHVGRGDYEKVLDSQIKHLSHSSQNLVDEFHEQ